MIALCVLAGLTAWLLVPRPAVRRLAGRREKREQGSERPDGYPRSWRGGFAVAVTLLLSFFWPTPLGAAISLLAGVGAYIASGYIPRVYDHRDETREMPDALEFLAVCLEAGAPIPTAVATVADVSPKTTEGLLTRVLAHLSVGRSAEEAWTELRDHPVWALPARDLIRSARSGTSLVPTLRLHAEDGRQARQDKETKAARTVGVKSVVPLMACFLPAFVLIGVIPIVASLLKNLGG